MTTRREALQLLGGIAVLGGLPRLTLAAPSGDERRLVFVFLRGGMDALSAVPAYGDPHYTAQRGILAVPPPASPGGALDLDGRFGLNPYLAEMHKLYVGRELAVLHAVASPYRERSHFDGQNLLENGTAKPFGRETGWLNAALAARPNASAGPAAFALGQSIPLVLRGPAPVGSWSPSRLPVPDSGLLDRLGELYRGDALLARSFTTAREAQKMMEGRDGMGGGGQPVEALAKAAGEILGKREGPRVASIDFGGWDTHIGQLGEYGPLTRNLRLLDRSVTTLKDALGPAWRHTAVLMVSEFGRTVAPNGSNGTDHGTGGAAFVAGGAVRGGRVITDWPGLAAGALHEGRDLRPTLDLRALFKAALGVQLGVNESALETEVFPDSRAVRPLQGLFA